MKNPAYLYNLALEHDRYTRLLRIYIESIMALEAAKTQNKTIRVTFTGKEYHYMQHYQQEVLPEFEKYWEIKDVTGNRIGMIIIDFTLKGNV